MFDVVTFGSATRDIFVRSKDLKIMDCPDFLTGKAVAVSAGSKVEIEELVFFTGGGGANTAATFAAQGLAVAYVGLVGCDANGEEIIKELQRFGVETKFVKTADKAQTPSSIILSTGKERTILVYQGASHKLSEEDIDWEKIRDTKWFYVSGLSGDSALIFAKIVNFAKSSGIKIAVNPGNDQLTKDLAILKQALPKIDVLIVNQEEATMITGIDYKKEEEIFKKLDDLVPGVAVMSKGPEGVAVSDGKKIYRAGIPKSGYVDRTGSGDAFGSGFVATIINGGSIEEAIQFGTANATSVIQQIGAKNGILKKDEWGEWKKVEVTKINL